VGPLRLSGLKMKSMLRVTACSADCRKKHFYKGAIWKRSFQMSVLGLGVAVRGQSVGGNRSGIRGPVR